jgi:hypothetical protein
VLQVVQQIVLVLVSQGMSRSNLQQLPLGYQEQSWVRLHSWWLLRVSAWWRPVGQSDSKLPERSRPGGTRHTSDGTLWQRYLLTPLIVWIQGLYRRLLDE